MKGRSGQARVGGDWVLRAAWYDHQLSARSPIYPTVRMHERPTSLQIDLHEGIEVGILLRGRQERHYPDYLTELTAGDVWLQPMWEPHGWRVAAPQTENVVLIFLPEFLGEEMLGEISWLSLFAFPPRQRPWVKDARLRGAMLSIGSELAQEIREQRRWWLTAVRLGLLRVLFLLRREWQPPARTAGATEVRTSNLSRLMPAVALIQERRPGTVTLEEAAGVCGLSRSRFGSLFSQTMGTSYGQFSLRARLAFAAHRLLTTDLPAEAIGHETGFVDGSHFHRSFVKHYGCTPREYRVRSR